MAINDSNVIFSTRYNFLKIYLNDTVDVAIASITPPFDSPISYLLTTHSLGYVPRAKVWYEPVSGQVWPMSDKQYSSAGGGSGTSLGTIGDYYLTSSGLYVRITNSSASTVTFYYRIYADE